VNPDDRETALGGGTLPKDGISADTQAAEIINLTRALKAYTIILAVIGVIQIALMLFRAGGA
jgi:hypothetical protein